MAGPYTRCNAGKVPTNGSGTPKSTPTVSRALTPASASASCPPERYTDEDMQRVTKLALESFVKGQEHGQLKANSVPYE